MSGTPPANSGGGNQPGSFSQEIQHANIGARVPEKIARGVFSNGVVLLQGASEFILDFVLRMNQPHQVVSRVVIPIDLMPRLIDALRSNLEEYRKSFGAPPAMPTAPPPAKPPSIEEIYDNLKMLDDVMSGSYANGVMMTHSASEFCFEFISNFYPRSAVSARVFLSIPQVPIMLNTLVQSWQTYQAKVQASKPPH